MTIQPSPALKDFWQRLHEVSSLLNLCNKVTIRGNSNQPPTGRQLTVEESICRASLLLLCSHMEGFFEKLIEDILQFHEINQTRISELPVNLRVIQIWKDPEGLKNAPSQKKLNHIKDISVNIFVDDNQLCKGGSFNLDLHIKGFASPGSGEVEKLFRSVGIDNIWNLVEQKAGTSILKSSLDNVVGKRHPIAHGNAGVKPTPRDVTIYIKDMCKLAIVFNIIVTEYICINFNQQDPWNQLN
ncbi:hypothetical protein A0J48_001430 [Sphaerospermopsis aphanizomenoides BCCUSP55]|uniref:MAE_28990/MAE_18760 family HEPN-like nuclease n=1 Tax=Sphaerospermopsis aphanizomenoides TaxID=459663 RepID=UPI00190649A7|nr:MAE_28990/MAE_18760 family HEPN-like nuclease [Sphaerospermopsis aphanizomenoides]MBK1986224.1 hypothetical protein [Sphaerospermopsis aphanizomenoides BCCUSP55]